MMRTDETGVLKNRQFYRIQVEKLTAEIVRRETHCKFFVAAELLAFAAVILAVVAYASWNGGWMAVAGGIICVAAFFWVRQKDVANDEVIREKEDLRSVYQKELSYLDGDFSCFSAGEAYVDPHHEFTFDMDIFGQGSLFNRMDRTITSGGSDFLAHELAETRLRSVAEISDRREAIAELAGREELRTRFMAYGQRMRIDTVQILNVLQAVKRTSVPRFASKPAAYWVAVCLLAAFWVAMALSFAGMVDGGLMGWWAIAQLFVVYIVCKKSLHIVSKLVSKIHKQLKAYVSLVTTICEAGLTAKEHQAIVGKLTADGADAIQSFKELGDILDALDRRGNALGLIIIDTLFLSDFFLLRRFLRWQSRYLLCIEDWIEAVSHFDALVSMATFRYNEPTATDAHVVESEEIVYEAHGLYHPFLGAKAVRNDFSIESGQYHIVTGANMAGKSTFLRSVGINSILAHCGLPVFAAQMTLSVFSLFSSMRTTDDLTRGISYFNAELLRLQQLLETCKQNRRTLIILDEILKGTNSLDKLNGSRLFLLSILSLPVAGIIATHDLELSKMEDEYPDRFSNYCFEIKLSDDITYTYKITKGVARNQNATHLLKKILA